MPAKRRTAVTAKLGAQLEYIAFDSHERYTWTVVEDKRGLIKREGKIPHLQGAPQEFLRDCEPGSPVETIGNWYWTVDEIEAVGMEPRLIHAGKAELMLRLVHKTGKLDTRGLNYLQRTGILPHGVDASSELSDKTDLA